jgi:proteasome lid subunit RPN8/RPN11
MITWTEQRPDFFHRPIEDLLNWISFTAACAVMLGGGERPKVVADRSTLDSVFSHLAEKDVEQGGLLLGNVHDLKDGGSQFVVAISDHVRSLEYDSTTVSLQMDSSVWERARLKAIRGQFVVGWYHSHPNLGVFFSGTDRRTQRAFFNHPHCVGLVIDPVRDEEKWFIGAESIELSPSQVLRLTPRASASTRTGISVLRRGDPSNGGESPQVIERENVPSVPQA